MPNFIIGIVSNMLAALFWSIAAIFYRISMRDGLDTLIANFFRIPAALLFLMFMIFLNGKINNFLESFTNISFLSTLFLATIVMNIVGDSLYLQAIKKAGVSIAYPISYSYPILVATLAYFVLGEQIGFALVIGIISGFIGIWLISKKDSQQIQSRVVKNFMRYELIGIVFAIGAAFSFSIGIILFTLSLRGFDPLITGFNKLIFLALMLAPYTFGSPSRFEKLKVGNRGVKFAILGGLFGVGVGDWLFYVGLSNVGASVSAVITNMSPLASLFLSRFLLGEEVKVYQVIGTFLIVLGVLIVALSP